MNGVKLTSDEKRTLVLLARATIAQWAGLPASMPATSGRLLTEKRGVFVTLRIHGDLRGCIGYIQPFETVADAVRELAVKSASEDPRFDPLTPEEVGQLSIEISVLTPLEPIGGPSEVAVGQHGLVVDAGWRRGLLLPEVAIEEGWDAEQFLSGTCRKAGLGRDAWRRPGLKLYRFETEHFSEETERVGQP
ncbi:MAG: AmmeMemoRadiSam system protein A [Bacteroidetes bacterium]|jgi:AmmeMemoRadiSam system protein A|nr:AmmeMemoRadiSam system protein A [Bacteroidota bacterium]